MAWSKRQKMIAVTTCREARLEDEHRKLILRQLPNAMHDANGKRSKEPSSTSSKLTQRDFEQFMAIIERGAGGKLLHHSKGYWQRKADDAAHRMRYRVQQISRQLEAQGLLVADGVGLAGFIEKRIAGGRTHRLEDLDQLHLKKLLIGLTNYGKHHGAMIAQ